MEKLSKNFLMEMVELRYRKEQSYTLDNEQFQNYLLEELLPQEQMVMELLGNIKEQEEEFFLFYNKFSFEFIAGFRKTSFPDFDPAKVEILLMDYGYVVYYEDKLLLNRINLFEVEGNFFICPLDNLYGYIEG